MLKEALQYIIGLKEPSIHIIGEQTYSDKQLHRINHNPKADPIKMNTLTSLVQYLASGIDTKEDKTLFVHVQSPTKVSVFSGLDEDRSREYLVEVNAQIPTFNFGQFIDHESFCINLQAKFLDSPERACLLKFAGTVEAGSIAEYGDDGITQKATVKTGIASKGEAIVPSPVTLVPFRTFPEIDQTPSEFIFRMKQDRNDGILCALFEADGGAWKNDAMCKIHEYLQKALFELCDCIVIA